MVCNEDGRCREQKRVPTGERVVVRYSWRLQRSSTRRHAGLVTALAVARVVAASAYRTVVAAHAGPVAADVVSALRRGVVTGFVTPGRGRVPPSVWSGVARGLGILAGRNAGFVETFSGAVASRGSVSAI